MDWTEKCTHCAKSNHNVNDGRSFACFENKCEYEPFEIGETYCVGNTFTYELNDKYNIKKYGLKRMVSDDEIKNLINYLIDIKVNLKEGLLKDIDTVLNYLKEKFITDTVEFDIDDDAGDELHSKFKPGDSVRIKDTNWIIKNCCADTRTVDGKPTFTYMCVGNPLTLKENQFLMAGKEAVIRKVEDNYIPFNKFYYEYQLVFDEEVFTKMFENFYFPEWVLEGVGSNGKQ